MNRHPACCRECELYATHLLDKDLDFNTQEEKDAIDVIWSNAMALLPESDRDLKFLERALPLLKKGIGVHHSGLLPILKEVTEILFQEQLVKVRSEHRVHKGGKHTTACITCAMMLLGWSRCIWHMPVCMDVMTRCKHCA